MAIGLTRENLGGIVNQVLSPMARYRCVVFQTPDIGQFVEICDTCKDTVQALGKNSRILTYRECFDDIGASDCQSIQERITLYSNDVVIFEGPLHFLDYWSEQTQNGFWGFLSSFSSGPGIIVVDTPRSECVEGLFRVGGRVGDSDVRYLKSRLAHS